MNFPQDGIKLHRGNFTAIGRQIQPYLEDGKCFRMVLKPWREKRSLSQNALSHMWYTEISEYLIARGKTFATPEWVKDAMKHTYLGYPVVDLAQSNNASGATGPNPFMINKASAPKVDGEIKVSFVNSPPGMRVMETRSSGFDVSHDVGYTRFGR